MRKIELSLTYQDLSNVNKDVFDAYRADFLTVIKTKSKQINSTSTQTNDKKNPTWMLLSVLFQQWEQATDNRIALRFHLISMANFKKSLC